MTWRDVLDCKIHIGHIDRFVSQVVHNTGYEFFAWNGRIYHYSRNTKTYEQTELTVDDLGD
jgi:hypothetical protein